MVKDNSDHVSMEEYEAFIAREEARMAEEKARATAHKKGTSKNSDRVSMEEYAALQDAWDRVHPVDHVSMEEYEAFIKREEDRMAREEAAAHKKTSHPVNVSAPRHESSTDITYEEHLQMEETRRRAEKEMKEIDEKCQARRQKEQANRKRIAQSPLLSSLNEGAERSRREARKQFEKEHPHLAMLKETNRR